MSTLLGNLRTLLLANGAVSARVGTSRIYNNRMPQNPVLPAILLTLLSDQPILSHSSANSIKRPTVEIMHFAGDHAVAETMDGETRAVLEGFRGAMGTLSAVTILRTDSRDDTEPDLGLAYRTAEYQIWHN